MSIFKINWEREDWTSFTIFQRGMIGCLASFIQGGTGRVSKRANIKMSYGRFERPLLRPRLGKFHTKIPKQSIISKNFADLTVPQIYVQSKLHSANLVNIKYA